MTARANDTSSLGEGEDAVAPVGEVIERAKDQHGVVAGLGKGQVPGISDVSGDTTAGRPELAGGDNVVGDGVDDAPSVRPTTTGTPDSQPTRSHGQQRRLPIPGQ